MDAGEWTTFLANPAPRGVVNDAGLDGAPSALGHGDRDRQAHRPAARVVVGLCLDTGHVYLAGRTRSTSRGRRGRVLHVHLKDVDQGRQVRSGEVPFRESVIDGLFVPLGQGAVDIAGVIIAVLEDDGYRGWYVLEQDVSLKGSPRRRRPEGGRGRQRRVLAFPGRGPA